jgi:peptide deformylase
MLARVLQHEIDHLDGTLFVDRMDKRDRKKIQKELNALASGIISAEYPVAREPLAAIPG